MGARNEAQPGGPPAGMPRRKSPVDRKMRLAVDSAEPGSSGNRHLQVFLAGEDRTAQRHFLRFRGAGPGL